MDVRHIETRAQQWAARVTAVETGARLGDTGNRESRRDAIKGDRETQAVPGLDHNICIVTGAARGIGAAIARSFAQEGAAVVVTDKDEGQHQNLNQHPKR